MEISCPECHVKFMVTQDQIGHGGRKVKCSKCFHIWHQNPNEAETEQPILMTSPAKITPLGNGVNLPALLPVKIPLYLYILPMVLIGLILLMSVMLFPHNLGLNRQDLSIKDLQLERRKESDKISVTYKIHNISNHNIQMPLVRIRLFDSGGRVIKTLIEDHTKVNLSPEKFIQIKSEFVPAPANADSIDIMIGNKMDFLLR